MRRIYGELRKCDEKEIRVVFTPQKVRRRHPPPQKKPGTHCVADVASGIIGTRGGRCRCLATYPGGAYASNASFPYIPPETQKKATTNKEKNPRPFRVVFKTGSIASVSPNSEPSSATIVCATHNPIATSLSK